MAAIKMTMRVPQYQEMDFADEAECVRFIISTNIHRRHLTESQRGMIAIDLAKLGDGVRQDRQGASIDAPSMTQGQAADAMQVSRASVQRAKAITKADPALAAEVNADKRRAVELLLACDKWRKNSDRWIAAKCGVSNELVGAVRKQVSDSDTSRTRTGKDGKKYTPEKLTPKEKAAKLLEDKPDMSVREVAKRVGVSEGTVRNWRRKSAQESKIGTDLPY